MKAIVIEQTLEQARMAFEVHQHAAMDAIRLARGKVSAHVSEDSDRRLSIEFSFKSKVLPGRAGEMLLEIAFRMSGTPETDSEDSRGKADPAVLVECAYEARYSLNEDFQVTEEQVKAFKDGNAIFNVWPYFREYLQNSLQRMGLPPFAAPFLRLEPKAPKKRKTAKPLAEAAPDAE